MVWEGVAPGIRINPSAVVALGTRLAKYLCARRWLRVPDACDTLDLTSIPYQVGTGYG